MPPRLNPPPVKAAKLAGSPGRFYGVTHVALGVATFSPVTGFVAAGFEGVRYLLQYPDTFLNAVQSLLQPRGWAYDPKTSPWSPER